MHYSQRPFPFDLGLKKKCDLFPDWKDVFKAPRTNAAMNRFCEGFAIKSLALIFLDFYVMVITLEVTIFTTRSQYYQATSKT